MVVGDDYHKMNPDNDKRAASSSVGKGTNTSKSCHLNLLPQEDQRPLPPQQQRQPLVASFVDVVGTDGNENDKDDEGDEE